MNKLFFIFIIFFAAGFNVAYSQEIKNWTETTVQDFSDNQMNDLVITNLSGGEVKLPDPIVKTQDDYNNNNVYRFIAKDSAGNFIRTWVVAGNVYVKKYNSNGVEVTGSIRVNEIDGIAGQEGISRADILNDGTYMIVWCNRWEPVTYAENMYCQIFKDDSVKIGNNFKINETYAASAQFPVVFANEADQTFWIFYSLHTLQKEYKIHLQKRDKLGNKTEETVLLNPESITINEMRPAVIGNDKHFYVAWDGSNGSSSWDIDIYLRKFNIDGSPASDIIMINDDLTKMQSQTDLEVDNNSNLFVSWIDERDAKPTQPNGCWYIYGQLYDKNLNTIGNNFRINSTSFDFNLEPDIEYKEDEFQVSYSSWDEPNRRYLFFINRWKFDPKFAGEMISSIFDCGPAGLNYDNFEWNYNPNTKSSIKFKIRTAKGLSKLENSNWYGPLDTADFYTNNSGINSIHNGDRYLQYKSIFSSETGGSAILNSVSIGFISNDTIPPATPENFEGTPSYSNIILNWKPVFDIDLMGYIIYKGLKADEYDENLKIFVPKNITSLKDDSVKSRTLYYYAIAAIDSNHNESNKSPEVFVTPAGINIYIKASAGSGGDGTINYPFNTIQQGFNNALFGDTLRILPGVYNNIFTMKDGVSLIGSNAKDCKINTPVTSSDNCIIKSLTITKSIICDNVSPVITGNIFTGTSDEWMPSIKIINSASPTITKNLLTDCKTGIQIINQCKPIIKNNILVADDIGIYASFSKVLIINNTVIGKSVNAINLDPFDTVHVENNILLSDRDPLNTFEPHIILYNNLWGLDKYSATLSSTNIFLDPKFINVDLQDFHLNLSSPCINAGNPNTIYNDIDGTRNDMGAYGGPDPIHFGLSSQLTRSLYVSNASAYPGDTVIVTINIDNSAGLTKGNFILQFDYSILEFINAECVETVKHFALLIQKISEGEVRFSFSSGMASIKGKNEILKVKFLVNKASKTGEASPLILRNISLVDANLNDIFLKSIKDGAFVVNKIELSKNYIYVDKSNTGIEDGSRDHPFKTITKAIDVAKNGDSILVAAGTYMESITMKDSICLIGTGALVTSIISPTDAFWFSNVKGSEVIGFTIKSSMPGGALMNFISSSAVIKNNCLEGGMSEIMGIVSDDNSNITITNNYFKETTINLTESLAKISNNFVKNSSSFISSSNNIAVEISNNTLYGYYASPIMSIFNDSNITIRNNVIFCNDIGLAIYLNNSDAVKIYNNIIRDEGRSGSGIRVKNSNSCEINNNTIITGGKGIEDLGLENTIMNNIVINSNNFGVLFSSHNCDYNNVWNNFVNYYETKPGLNDLSFNPLFVDTLKGNFRLSKSSPCLNKGNPNIDYNDIDGSRNDIGAYGGPYADSLWIYSNGSSLSIDSLTVSSSDTTIIKIYGEEINGLSGIEFTLSYDPSLLSISGANVGSITKNFSLEKKILSSGTMLFSLEGSKGIMDNKGDIVELQLVSSIDKNNTAILHFDNAFVTDEASYSKRIFNLNDGQIQIISGLDNEDIIPATYSLSQNYPNPFNPSTTIRYELPRESKVQLIIYNILGEKIVELVNTLQKPGKYEVEWNATNYASGVYIYQIKMGEFIFSKKLILLK